MIFIWLLVFKNIPKGCFVFERSTNPQSLFGRKLLDVNVRGKTEAPFLSASEKPSKSSAYDGTQEVHTLLWHSYALGIRSSYQQLSSLS